MRSFHNNILSLCSLLLLLVSCSLSEQKATPLNTEVSICPDYKEVTMPCNIAPPTFSLEEKDMLSDAQAIFSSGKELVIVGNDGDAGFCIDIDDWHKLVGASDEVSVRIQGKDDGGNWVEYNKFYIYISKDSIDPYLAYRLIEPGYEQWNEMGIYQRNLESYEEEAILTNKQTNGGCMNCHSFCQYDPNKMMFHLRMDYAGTYISDLKENGTAGTNFNHITPSPSFVYPSWHPSGNFIAFSNNQTKQLFHTTDVNRIEVFDYSSDVIVYDVKSQEVITCPLLSSKDAFETFPSWSPDGKKLYFCSADSVLMPDDYDKLYYSLCSISFDPSSRTFGEKVDTLYHGGELIKEPGLTQGGSVSFPRVSPNGKYLIFTRSEYGNFSIWHKKAELAMIKLGTDNSVATCIDMKELGTRNSYHSWSSNSRWLVYSSRRNDGLYTRPYIVHIDENGSYTKPFILPEVKADYYLHLMKSYNIPEFIKGKVNINRDALINQFQSQSN